MGKAEPQDLEASLRQAIAASEMTHYALGKASGVTPDMIGRFMKEDDPRGINLKTASKLATALGYKLVKCDDATVLEKKPAKGK